MSDLDNLGIAHFIKCGPNDIQIENQLVEGAIAAIGLAVGAAAVYKLLKDDKPIMESIIGKKDTPLEK